MDLILQRHVLARENGERRDLVFHAVKCTNGALVSKRTLLYSQILALLDQWEGFKGTLSFDIDYSGAFFFLFGNFVN